MVGPPHSGNITWSHHVTWEHVRTSFHLRREGPTLPEGIPEAVYFNKAPQEFPSSQKYMTIEQPFMLV